MRLCSPEHPLKLAVLISGNGSNLQALIDAIDDGLPAEIQVVISDQAGAYGLERAKRAQIPVAMLLQEPGSSKTAYDNQLIELLDRYQPELIVLAGFMRILTADCVEHFKNRIINIHPSLLPNHPGINTHQRVLSAKDKVHGTTVHVVTPQLDSGPIIMQATVTVSPNDDVHTLRNKVHTLEHKLYPHVVRLVAQGRLRFEDQVVLLDGDPLPSQGLEFRMHY